MRSTFIGSAEVSDGAEVGGADTNAPLGPSPDPGSSQCTEAQVSRFTRHSLVNSPGLLLRCRLVSLLEPVLRVFVWTLLHTECSFVRLPASDSQPVFSVTQRCTDTPTGRCFRVLEWSPHPVKEVSLRAMAPVVNTGGAILEYSHPPWEEQPRLREESEAAVEVWQGGQRGFPGSGMGLSWPGSLSEQDKQE